MRAAAEAAQIKSPAPEGEFLSHFVERARQRLRLRSVGQAAANNFGQGGLEAVVAKDDHLVLRIDAHVHLLPPAPGDTKANKIQLLSVNLRIDLPVNRSDASAFVQVIIKLSENINIQ